MHRSGTERFFCGSGQKWVAAHESPFLQDSFFMRGHMERKFGLRATFFLHAKKAGLTAVKIIRGLPRPPQMLPHLPEANRVGTGQRRARGFHPLAPPSGFGRHLNQRPYIKGAAAPRAWVAIKSYVFIGSHPRPGYGRSGPLPAPVLHRRGRQHGAGAAIRPLP